MNPHKHDIDNDECEIIAEKIRAAYESVKEGK